MLHRVLKNKSLNVFSNKNRKYRLNSTNRLYKNQIKISTQIIRNETTLKEIGQVNIPFDPSSVKRGNERQKCNIAVNDKLYGYHVKSKKFVEERNLTVYELVHELTNAKHLHIECEDSDNVFYIAFKTIPDDNKGSAHILEHLTLCGSEKYPVRDPFFNMMKRSLNTYMNAWTGPDITAYPFSSQNIKDYFNLMSVYLDAVFHSNLNYYDFLQEGHRLEFNEETDSLEHQGVVYNEMKGAMSEPGDIYIRELYRHLYPTTTYHYNSGGDPKYIRDINHDDVKNFKSRFYHPSNSYTITYGDMPLEPQLQYINECFKNFERIDPKNDLADEIRYSEPKKVVFEGPLSTLSDPNKQVKVSINWLVDKGHDSYERFAMSILSFLMVTGAASPMYEALISTNIGSSYTPGTGYDGSPREGFFSIGLSDIEEKDVKMVENMILTTLDKVAIEGFPDERVDSILHQIEYGLKNITTGYGLQLVSTIPSSWIHGSDPLESFAANEMIDRLRKDIAKGNFFQALIKKWLINNNHRLTFIMKPNKHYSQEEVEEEEESLRKIIEDKHFVKTRKNQILENSKNLEQRQEQIDDIDILPKIRLNEIERNIERVNTEKIEINNVHTIWNDQPTNDIVYFNSFLDINDIPEDLLAYVPLFTSTLVKMSTKSKTYQELDHEIELKTGSFRTFQSIESSNTTLEDYDLYLGLTSSCLSKNVDPMFDLWEHMIKEISFEDNRRLKTIIGDISSSLQSSVLESGHKLATILSSENLLPHYKIREIWDGLYQLRFMRELNEMQDLTDVSHKLKQLANILITRERMKIAINSESKDFEKVLKRIHSLTESVEPSINFSKRLAPKIPVVETNSRVYVGLESQVNFISQSFRSVPYTHDDFSKLDVFSQLISTNYLHKEIREKGGAYGAGLSHNNGVLSFYSYRDPHMEETLDVYSRTTNWIKQGKFTDDDIEEAKLQLFSYLDMPIPPSGKGLEEFSSGLTLEMRQNRRNKIFEVTRDDMFEMSDKYLKDQANNIAVLGTNQDETYKENKEWTYREY